VLPVHPARRGLLRDLPLPAAGRQRDRLAGLQPLPRVRAQSLDRLGQLRPAADRSRGRQRADQHAGAERAADRLRLPGAAAARAVAEQHRQRSDQALRPVGGLPAALHRLGDRGLHLAGPVRRHRLDQRCAVGPAGPTGQSDDQPGHLPAVDHLAGDLEGDWLGHDHLPGRDGPGPGGAVRGGRRGRRRRRAADVARHAARDHAGDRAAADPPPRVGAHRRVRADHPAAGRGRRRRGTGAGHVRLLPRRARRRLGPGHGRRPGQGRRRHGAGDRRQLGGQAARRGGRVLMSTATVAFRPRWNQPTLTSTVLKAVVLAVTIVIMVYPFLYVIATSFAAPPGEAGAFSLDAYASVLSGGIVLRSLLVSIGITVVGTLLSVVLTVLLAYGLMNTREVPGGRVILYLVLFTMLFGAGIIPNYLLVKELGLLDSYAALILPGAISAFNMVVVRNFFQGIPRELIECARIDG